MKNKDKKIQELKDSIFTLEETIMKLKKKEVGSETNIMEIEKMRIYINQFERDKKRAEENYLTEISRNNDEIRELKR